MAKKNETGHDDSKVTNQSGLSRRDFVKSGAAATLTAAALLEPSTAQAQRAGSGASGIDWDYDVDVVIAGGGCAGLTAAIRARDLGATVLVVDQNFDLGGRMLHSGSFVSLGGGDPLQRRDMKGESDKEGFVTSPPVESSGGARRQRRPAVHGHHRLVGAEPPRRDAVPLQRARARARVGRELRRDAPVPHRQLRALRPHQRHARRRRHVARARRRVLPDARRQDRHQGRHDHGRGCRRRRQRAHEPVRARADEHREPLRRSNGAVSNGVALSRSLEFSAREKGVQFMLFRKFTDLVREQPFAGRIVGIEAQYSPRNHPETGELLQSFWQNGNVDERRETIRIRARKAVILASGGHAGNPEVRSMFYPAMREPAFPTSGLALQGPNGQDASALIAALKVGANLAGMQQNLGSAATFHLSTRLGTRDAYTDMMPGHPTFGFRGSAGVNVGTAGFEEFIAVNQVGKRFFNEVRLPMRGGGGQFPGGGVAPNAGIEHKPTDWRNCRHEWVQTDVHLRPRLRRRARDQRRLAAAALLLGAAVGDLRSGRRRARASGSCASRTSPTTATTSRPTRSRSWPRRSRRATSSSACR